ncbi:hypothetical protein, partial [Kaarinaea lacus]
MKRRQFLSNLIKASALLWKPNIAVSHVYESARQMSKMTSSQISLFLCGDVMTGRGIDQVM